MLKSVYYRVFFLRDLASWIFMIYRRIQECRKVRHRIHGSTHYHVIWCYFFQIAAEELTLAVWERDLKDHLQFTETCIALIVQSHNSNLFQAFCFPLYMFARFPFYKDFSLSTILFSQKINTVTRRPLTYLIISCIYNALKRKWQ